ncbi:MAG: hypothetical protein N2691_05415 [Patescibacteria group bacterium]|nr:hypothetical protein [Patescibacteria group bacterium]
MSDPVRKLTVGIQTDGDQVLKGANGGVNYATESIAGNPVVTLDSVGGKSAQLDRVAQQIGQGSVVKQAFDLQPNESYTVRGAFAATMVQLYSTELAVFLLILGIGFMGGFILIRILTKQYVRRFLITRKNSFPIQNMLVAILAGSGSALVIVLYTVLAGIFYYLFSINLYGHALTMFLGLCLFIVSAGVYLFFFTVPALVVGIRKGLWTGVVTAFITLSILVGISIIILVFTLLFRAPPQDYPLYRMSSDEAPAVDMTK